MSKGDRVTARTRDGALFSLVATKVGGKVDAIFDAPDDPEELSTDPTLLTLTELTRSGEILRSVELDGSEVMAVVRDHDGDTTLGGTRGKK